MITLGDIPDTVPADIKEPVLRTTEQMSHNKLDPFVGPIRRQDGSLWLEQNQTATDADLETMNFYVAGIDSQLG